jgi:hypothetical protein
MRLIATILCFFLSSSALAEIYQGIGPLDNLGDVRARFPSAAYENIKAAWVTESDALYKISGMGISGDIYVKFSDSRPEFRKMIQESDSNEPNETLNSLAQQSDEEALSVEWVRWIPVQPIPLQRFILKYGNPSKSGFDDQDLEPYKLWESRGISAYISDNEKHVLRVDYTFTNQEYRAAYKAKYKFIPKWLEPDKKVKK